jgi:hypothetical protein
MEGLMRTKTRWWAGAVVLLFGLFVAYLAQERRRPASDPGSERGHEFESQGEAIAAARGARQLLPPLGLGIRPNWQVSTGRSPITDDITVQWVTSSRNEIEDEEGTFRPTLVLRCEGRELEVSVVTGRAAKRLPGFEDEHAVTIRFGESPARDVRVRSRFERRVLLLEPAADVIREMLQSDKLLFSFTSLSRWLAPQAMEMSFDLSGLRDAVPELNETCSL